MALRDLFVDIALAWPGYLVRKRTDKTAAAHRLVAVEIPTTIKEILGPASHLHVRGSDGAGNITATPWVGIFDPRVTTSATSGYYIVYLYSVDLRSLTLCLAFGITQFEKQFGGPRAAFPPMREAALRLQNLYNSFVPDRYSRLPIALAADRRHRLHFAYEQSAVFSLAPYAVDDLPTDQQLQSDLLEIVGIYNAIMEDPLRPEIEQLIQSVVPAPTSIDQIEVRDFEPRSAKKGVKGTSRAAGRQRYSPQSRKVGDAGEQAVLRYEKFKLESCGRQDLVPKICHHAADGEFPGWDITSYDEDGTPIFIEVKSSIGSSVSAIDITSNEWRAATASTNQGRYFIYIVTNALSPKPRIERLRNPYGYVSSGQLALEPLVFQLSFQPPKSTGLMNDET